MVGLLNFSEVAFDDLTSKHEDVRNGHFRPWSTFAPRGLGIGVGRRQPAVQGSLRFQDALRGALPVPSMQNGANIVIRWPQCIMKEHTSIPGLVPGDGQWSGRRQASAQLEMSVW